MVIEAVVILMFVLLWLLFTNQRTHRERIAAIPDPRDPEFWAKFERFESVSYGTHWFYVSTLRDATKLYR